MKTYYIQNVNNHFDSFVFTEEEYKAINGDLKTEKFVNQVYKNIITIYEVPEEFRSAVQTIVNNRILTLGDYNTGSIPAKEIKSSLLAASFPCETRQETKELIENFVLLRESISDEQASLTPDIFPLLKETGAEIPLGARYKWNGKIKKAKKNCHDIKEDNPENTPDNWEDLDYEDGFRTTSSVFAKGQEFGKGDYGFKKGVLYKSKIDNNGWDPELYPDYWEIAEVNPKKPKHRKENH